jgi:P4 family phage/plasmid primase-like protien
MAPSIHPETGQPYTCTAPLYEVKAILPMVPDDFESLIRSQLIAIGYKVKRKETSAMTDFVPLGARDNKMISVSGMLAGDILKRKITFVEAVNRLHSWADGFVQNVDGDPLDLAKGEEKIIEFLQEDVEHTKKPLPLGWDEGLDPEYRARILQLFKQEDLAMTYEAIKEEYRNLIRGGIEQRDEVTKAKVVQETVEKIARNIDVLSELQVSSLLRYIKDTASIPGITESTLKREISKLKMGEVMGTDQTQLAKAVISSFERYGEVRYHLSNFWQWKGANWERIEDYYILRHIAENYGHCMAAKRSNDHWGVMKIMATLVQKDLQQVPMKGINFANGYLTQDQQLLNHSADFGAVYTLGYRYLPEAAGHFPHFKHLLETAWGADPDYVEKVTMLQEAIAATMFGLGPKYQRAILLYGVANSGKSTLLEVMRGLLPQEVQCSVGPESWGDKFIPSQMNHKLLNICGELSDSRKIDSKHFKEIIEGSPMNGQFKGKDIFTFSPTCTHWFGSNHLPKTDDTSEGFTRRWLIFRFDNSVPEHLKDRNLAQKIIMHEREAIIAWAVMGLERLLKIPEEYSLAPSHCRYVQELAEMNNSIRFFLSRSPRLVLWKHLTPTEQQSENFHGFHITLDTLYTEFKAFCGDTGRVNRASLNDVKNMVIDVRQMFGIDVKDEFKNGKTETTFFGLTRAKSKKAT